MILYHGSNQLITVIDLSKSKDFKPMFSSDFIFPIWNVPIWRKVMA